MIRASFVGHDCPAMCFWVMEDEKNQRSITRPEESSHPSSAPTSTTCTQTCRRNSRTLPTLRIHFPTTSFRCDFACLAGLYVPLTPAPSGTPPTIPEGGITVAHNSANEVQLCLGSNKEPKERTPSRGRRSFTRYPPSSGYLTAHVVKLFPQISTATSRFAGESAFTILLWDTTKWVTTRRLRASLVRVPVVPVPPIILMWSKVDCWRKNLQISKPRASTLSSRRRLPEVNDLLSVFRDLLTHSLRWIHRYGHRRRRRSRWCFTPHELSKAGSAQIIPIHDRSSNAVAFVMLSRCSRTECVPTNDFDFSTFVLL